MEKKERKKSNPKPKPKTLNPAFVLEIFCDFLILILYKKKKLDFYLVYLTYLLIINF